MTASSLVERLKEHVSIDSIFPGEHEYAKLMERRLESMGFDVRRQEVEDGRFNLLAERGSGDITVGFYGHMDTVPVYGEWTSPPHEPRVEGGRMYGLGSSDMKSGNMAILEAVDNAPEDVRIQAGFGVDEEYMSRGSTALVGEGWFSDADIVLVPEPANKTSHREVNLGRRGRISIEVEVHGVSAHAAVPERGESAVKNAAGLVMEMDSVEVGEDPDMGPAALTIRSLESDAGSLSIPEKATMIIDRHMVPGETVEGCLEQVRDAADRAGVDVDVALMDRPTPYLMPYKTSTDAPSVERFMDVVEDMHGSPETVYGKSVADENRIAELGVPVVSYGPMGGNEHSADEWVDLESVEELVETYRNFLKSVSG